MRNALRSIKFEKLEPRNLLAVLAVTTPLDVVDSDDGFLSLREAIIESNANGEDDSIQLAAETYTMSIGGIYEDAGLTGDFDILADNGQRLEILGHIDGSTIDGAQLDRVFEIRNGSNVSMSQITIQNGNLLYEMPFTGLRGAGIKSTQSILSLTQVQIVDNTATYSGAGGGVWISGGSYNFETVTFERNVAGYDGAALFARNSTGVIDVRSGFFDNVNAEPPSGNHNEVGVVSVLGGSLSTTGTKIDENFRGIGIKVVDGILDAVHIRIKNGERGIHAMDSQINVTDSRFSRLRDAAIFAGGTSDLTITDVYVAATYSQSIGFQGDNLMVSMFIVDQLTTGNSRPSITISSTPEIDQQIRLEQLDFINVKYPALTIDSPGANSSVVLDGFTVSNHGRNISHHDSVMFDISADSVEARNVSMTINFFDTIKTGIRVVADTFLMENSELLDVNRGTALDVNARQVDILESTFSGNQASMFLHPSMTESITRVSGTTVVNGDPNEFGSPQPPLAIALHWDAIDSLLIVDGSTFMDNVTDGGDAIVRVNGENNEVLATGLRFTGNVADDDGIFKISGSGHQVVVANSLFADNTGGLAGAFYVDATETDLSIYSSTLIRNLTTRISFDNGGGGVMRSRAATGTNLLVVNSILVGNGFNGSFEDSHVRNDNGTTIIRNSCIVDYDAGDGSILFGGAANNNTDAKPVFVDYRGGDFRLKVNSPLRDIGSLADQVVDSFDLDNDGDTTEALPDLDMLDRVSGDGLDLGAFEFPVML